MAKKSKPRIEPAENGPYLVHGLEEFRASNGDPIPTRKTIALCRCGASNNKPFCDGTHKKFSFTSDKLTDGVWNKRTNYEGKKITIHDNRGICSHAGFCTGGLPAVWKMGVEPWINPEGAPPEAIIETIRKCPSGALSYSVGGRERRNRPGKPLIQLGQDGPYQIRGGVELVGAEWGEEASREHYTLCRCGGSRNKPFCDGSHWYIKFRHDEAALTRKEENGERQRRWHRAVAEKEIPVGAVRVVQAGSKALALAHLADGWAALENRCPHQGGPLGEGTIEKGCLRCPWHGWEFDPRKGKSADGHGAEVVVYPVELREGSVFVEVEEEGKAARTTSHVMVETMVNWGITHVFGMVGHSNLGLADAVREAEEAGRLTYIGVRHEGAASFAASGFAKVSGKPAACLSIAGPGATNLLTGLWDAKVDRAPVLALTGQVEVQVLGPGAFQEIDLASAFSAVTSWSQTVLHGSRPAELMNLALKNAIVRRDVAHLIFPDEVQVQPVPEGTEAGRPEGRLSETAITPSPKSLQEAHRRLARAKRPVIIVGYGAREAMHEVVRLAERLRAPVLTTFKAKGQISDHHPLGAGVLGRSGTPVASTLMSEADLLLVFGASFSNHTGIADDKPIIQVDFDRMALGKLHAVTVPVWGEIATTAALLRKGLTGKLAAVDARPEVVELWRAWRKEKERRGEKDRHKGLNSAAVFAALTRQAPPHAVISVDVGNNTYSFGRYFECAEHSVIMSGYLGSIGFGFPGAMGAWAAAPDRPVICVTGDGGFGQYMGEFTTAVKYGMNLAHVLLNNSEIAKISKEQRAANFPVWQTSLRNPDFSRFAKNCGGMGIRVRKREDLDAALREAIAYEGPALVEILTDSELI